LDFICRPMLTLNGERKLLLPHRLRESRSAQRQPCEAKLPSRETLRIASDGLVAGEAARSRAIFAPGSDQHVELANHGWVGVVGVPECFYLAAGGSNAGERRPGPGCERHPY